MLAKFIWCQLGVCSCLNHQECDRGVLAGDYAFVSVGSGVWTRPLHRPPHHVSGPRGRLRDWLCLLLLRLVHLLQLLPGQGSTTIIFCLYICQFFCSLARSFSSSCPFFRCWICSWLWSWTTLSTWHETPQSWGPITWTSLFASGGSMIAWHGEILLLLLFYIFI